jgi:beta-lactamase class D
MVKPFWVETEIKISKVRQFYLLQNLMPDKNICQLVREIESILDELIFNIV